jgi:hypothetical protein
MPLSIVATRVTNATLTLSAPQSFAIQDTDASASLTQQSTGVAGRIVATAGSTTFPTWSTGTSAIWVYVSGAINP